MNIKTDDILDFIKRRFPCDSNWCDGNCYYFAVILKDRFPQGQIFYDVILGHFVFCIYNKYYDWTGIIKSYGYLVPWDDFDIYDSLQKKTIIKNCIN